MMFNIITAQNPLVIERKQPRKFDFATSAFRKGISIVYVHNINYINCILQSISLDNAALFNGRVSSLIAQMQITSMAKYLKFLYVLRE